MRRLDDNYFPDWKVGSPPPRLPPLYLCSRVGVRAYGDCRVYVCTRVGVRAYGDCRVYVCTRVGVRAYGDCRVYVCTRVGVRAYGDCRVLAASNGADGPVDPCGRTRCCVYVCTWTARANRFIRIPTSCRSVPVDGPSAGLPRTRVPHGWVQRHAEGVADGQAQGEQSEWPTAPASASCHRERASGGSEPVQ